MKITIINGSMRKGSTYKITQQFIDNISSNKKDVKEFFLPRDEPNFCTGCFNCFTDNTKCPHYKYINPIVNAIEEADLIIFQSPVYVYHVSGQMKTLLDHLGYRWMVHKPSESMFKKQAIVISTAAGAGTKSAMKDVLDSFFYWGIGKSYKYGVNVYATSFEEIDEKRQNKIKKDINKLCKKIKRDSKCVKPNLKTKALFHLIRMMNKKKGFSESDKKYWKEKGWIGKKRPW